MNGTELRNKILLAALESYEGIMDDLWDPEETESWSAETGTDDKVLAQAILSALIREHSNGEVPVRREQIEIQLDGHRLEVAGSPAAVRRSLEAFHAFVGEHDTVQVEETTRRITASSAPKRKPVAPERPVTDVTPVMAAELPPGPLPPDELPDELPALCVCGKTAKHIGRCRGTRVPKKPDSEPAALSGSGEGFGKCVCGVIFRSVKDRTRHQVSLKCEERFAQALDS